MDDVIKLKWETDLEWHYRSSIYMISITVAKFLEKSNVNNTNRDYQIIYNGIEKQLQKLELLNVPKNYNDMYYYLVQGIKHYLKGFKIMLDLDLKDKKNSKVIVKAGQYIEIGVCFCKISAFESTKYIEYKNQEYIKINSRS